MYIYNHHFLLNFLSLYVCIKSPKSGHNVSVTNLKEATSQEVFVQLVSKSLILTNANAISLNHGSDYLEYLTPAIIFSISFFKRLLNIKNNSYFRCFS